MLLSFTTLLIIVIISTNRGFSYAILTIFIPKEAVIIKRSVFNIGIYVKKELLFLTLILKIVDRDKMDFHCQGKMHDDLIEICLVYCMVINWLLREQHAF